MQFITQPTFYSDISPLIFLYGIFVVCNHGFLVVYYSLLLIVVYDSLGI